MHAFKKEKFNIVLWFEGDAVMLEIKTLCQCFLILGENSSYLPRRWNGIKID